MRYQTLRRYSDFRLFMREMMKLNPTCERHFPPRKWVFKKSSAVVRQRQHLLNLFLKRAIVLCINSQQSHGIDTLVTFLRLDDKLDRITSESPTRAAGLVRRQSNVSFAPAPVLLPVAYTHSDSGSDRSTLVEPHRSPPPPPREGGRILPSSSVRPDQGGGGGGGYTHANDNHNDNDNSKTERDGDAADEEDGGLCSWGLFWLLLRLLLLALCGYCALRYGSFFLFFDAFDLDRHGR